MRRLSLGVGGIVTSLAGLGIVVAPRRTIAAFRAGASGPSLFALDDAGELLGLTVGRLEAVSAQ